MAGEKDLALGVVFKGSVDQTFTKATKNLKKLLDDLNGALKKTAKSGLGGLSKYLSSSGSELSQYGKAAGKAVDETNNFHKALNYFGKGRAGLAFEQVHKTLIKVEKAIQAKAMRMRQAGRDGDKYAQKMNRINLVNKILQGSLKATSTGFVRVGDSARKASAEVNSASAGITRTKQAFGSLGIESKKTVSMMDRLGMAFKTIAVYGFATTLVYRFIGSIKEGTRSIIEYDQSLKNLEAITGATKSQIAAMDEVMRDVARNTKFSTNEVAEGMTLLGQAGLSAEESLKAIRATSDLATGTLSSFKLTTDLMTTTIRAFGLQAEESGRVADVMANAINNSKLNIDKLRIAFNFVGASSAQTGLSLEETAASLMVLANNGLRASTMGTGLRQVLSRLLSPNKKLRESFEQFGVELKDVNPRMVGYQTAMKNMLPVLWDHEKGTVNMARAYELFGLRGAQAMAVLGKAFATTGKGSFADALEKTSEIGSAAKMAAIQAEGLGLKFKQLVDRAKLVFQALGDAGLTGILRTFVNVMREGLVILEKFVSSGLGSFLVKTVAIALSIGLLVKAFVALKAGILALNVIVMATGFFQQLVAFGLTPTIAKVITLWSVLMKNPFVWIATAIGATIAALMHFATAEEKAVKEAGKMSVQLKSAANTLMTWTKILGDAKGDQAKYNNLTKRFAQENKELAKEIMDVANVSNLAALEFDKIKEIFEQVTAEKLKGSLEQTSKELEFFVGKFTEASDRFKKDKNLQKAFEMKGLKFEDFEKTKVAVSGINEKTKELGNSLYDYIQLLDVPESKWKSLAALYTKSFKVQEGILDQIRGRFKEESKIMEIRKAETKKFFNEWPKQWQDALNKADDEWKASLVKQYRLMKNNKALMKKELDELVLAEKMTAGVRESILKAEEASHLEIWRNKQKRKSDLEKKANYDSQELHIQNLRKMLSLTEDADQKLRLKKQVELAELDIWYSKGLDLAGKNDKEIKKIQDGYLERKKAIEGLSTKVTKKESKRRVDEIEKEYRRRKITAEEYVLALKGFEEQDAITTRELEERTIAATGTFGEQLSLGFKKSREEMTTWGDTLISITETLPEKFADGMGQAFGDFITGTKSASEAFANFGRSTLSWLSQMIIRQQILNAIQGMAGFFSGAGAAGGAGSAASPNITGSSVINLHKGGIVGKPADVRIVNPNIFANAKRYHDGGTPGLRNDEVPAVLQKGEGVFTQDQMQALGRQELTIVNVPDARLIDGYLATAKGKRAILNVISQEVSSVRKMIR